MKVETDRKKTRGICELFPETNKERKALFKIHDLIVNDHPTALTFDCNCEVKSLIIFREE